MDKSNNSGGWITADQSVACLASDKLDSSAVQVRIPLATLAKMLIIGKTSGMYHWLDCYLNTAESVCCVLEQDTLSAAQ